MSDGVLELRLVVTAPDYDDALTFYRDGLGMVEIAAFTSHGARVTILDARRAPLEIADPPHAVCVDAVASAQRPRRASS
jgi:lactoylglutathione lyase